MLLKDIFAGHRPVISVEFFPPKTAQGEANLAARVAVIKALKPSFCSVTYGAGGGTRDTTLTWVRRLKHEFGIEAVAHLACVGHSRDEILRVLEQLQRDGIENIMALRGDPPAGATSWEPHPDGFHHAADLVHAIKEFGGFGVGVAGFPEVHPEAESREADFRFLREKVDAGADVIVTQLFFDNHSYLRYVEDCLWAGIKVPIVPGILPFRTVQQLERFTTVYARTKSGAAYVPVALRERLEAVRDDHDTTARLGVDYGTEQCRRLLERGAPGIHFYCLNESQSVEAIMQNLRLRPGL